MSGSLLSPARLPHVLWLANIQYFVVQLVVANSWNTPFSLKQNVISDLGNTACGIYGQRYVCSPLHNMMNLSFLVLGITTVVGALLLYKQKFFGARGQRGLQCMVLAGVGTILIGVFPENSIGWLHGLGASLPFFFGNLGMVLIGSDRVWAGWLRYVTLLCGGLGLVGLAIYQTDSYLLLGRGGMERLVAYPQTIWMIIFAIQSLPSKNAPN